METFNFYLDTKVTAWYRTPFEIEADTLEEAKLKAIEFVKSGETSYISWEQIDDTVETMSVKDNDGESTEELYCTDDVNMIWDNTETNIMVVYNNVESKNVFEGNESQFIDFMRKIVIENEDYDFSIIGLSDAIEYLENYCSNLEINGTE